MKNPNNKPRIVILVIMLSAIFFTTPYLLNPLILPGKSNPNSSYFAGEWFNRIEPADMGEYQMLNRWAHYFGRHGCEPEWDNCPYRGVTGQWRLLLDYLQEDKPFSVDLIKVGN